MKTTIVAKNKEHLQQFIKEILLRKGNECSLNHIDVFNITDMSHLFEYSQFNGDISFTFIYKIAKILY